MISGLAKAFQESIMPKRDDLTDDLMISLEKNCAATTSVRHITDRLDKKLCLDCGPSRFRLRRLKLQQAGAGLVH